MRCKVCGEYGPRFLWHGTDGAAWFRCNICASDSSSDTYEDVKTRYNADYLQHNLKSSGSRAALIETMVTNLDWFNKFSYPTGTFLDIGCNEGCAMEGMASRGWIAYGFDVNPAAAGVNIVIADSFNANLFTQKFGAIQLREVIEHIGNWQNLLDEVTVALLPEGLLQIQTPRPMQQPDDLPYCHDHLQLFLPQTLRGVIERRGFEILDKAFWPQGQKWMARKR